MARSREIHKTVFAFGEGESENIFLKHLRSIYSSGKTEVRVDHAGGKDMTYILEKAQRVRSFNHYDHSIVLLDTVPRWTKDSLMYARKNNFEIIGSEPCIEAVFLKILNPGRSIAESSPHAYKKRFSTNHINNRNLIDDAECKKLFLKSRIDAARGSLKNLNRLIKILEGNF